MKIERTVQEILSSKGNLMLIENSIKKIEKSINNIIAWAEDAEHIQAKDLSDRIKSNALSAIKEISQIKKEF